MDASLGLATACERDKVEMLQVNDKVVKPFWGRARNVVERWKVLLNELS